MNCKALVLISALMALEGCASDPRRQAIDPTPGQQTAVDSNRSCTAISDAQVKKITGSSIARKETPSGDAPWCRFTLQDGQWFDLFLHSISKETLFMRADCDDQQNGPSYSRIHHPNCFAIAGPDWTHLQSSRYFGMPKELMRQLLDSAVSNLATASGNKVINP